MSGNVRKGLHRQELPTGEKPVSQPFRQLRGLKLLGGLGGVLLLGYLACSMAGCQKSSRTLPPPQSTKLGGESSSAISMIKSALGSFMRYAQNISTDPQEPQPIVNLTSTNDRQHALATIEDDERLPGNQFNILNVVTKNARLKTNDVQPGDIVKYFAGRDELELKEVAVQFRVAGDVEANRLRLAERLAFPIPQPFRVEIFRERNELQKDVGDRLAKYVEQGIPATGWEPTTEQRGLQNALGQIRTWALDQDLTALKWTEPALYAKLLPALRELPQLRGLGEMQFPDSDDRVLQEAVLLKSIAHRIAAGQATQLGQGLALFQWTVNNVQLADDDVSVAELQFDANGLPEPSDQIDRRDPVGPDAIWKILVLGQGNAEQRAWVFMSLARQLALDVVLLSWEKNAAAQDQVWVCGLLVDKELYLFDPKLGLPIPLSATDLRMDEASVATLSAVRAKPELLRALDLGADRPYWARGEQLQNLTALIGCGPHYLSKRMAAITKFSPDDLRLVIHEDVDELAGRVSQLPGIAHVKLWEFPYENYRISNAVNEGQRQRLSQRWRVYAVPNVPTLYKGRLLQLLGQGDATEPGIASSLQLYMDSRLSFLSLARSKLNSQQTDFAIAVKRAATFGIGLQKLDAVEPDPKVALDWLDEKLLRSEPEGPLKSGILYQMARAHEMLGEFDQAVATLEATAELPQGHGNLLRAKRIRAQYGLPASDPGKSPLVPAATDEATPEAAPAAAASTAAVDRPDTSPTTEAQSLPAEVAPADAAPVEAAPPAATDAPAATDSPGGPPMDTSLDAGASGPASPVAN